MTRALDTLDPGASDADTGAEDGRPRCPECGDLSHDGGPCRDCRAHTCTCGRVDHAAPAGGTCRWCQADLAGEADEPMRAVA